MSRTHTARDAIRTYVRLLADWWTPPVETDRRVEEVYQAVRNEVLAEAAELIRRHPGPIPYIGRAAEHGEGAGFWADTRDRDAAANLLIAAQTTTNREN